MSISLLYQYSNEEFIEVIKNSFTYKECLQSLGYNSMSGSSVQMLKKRIQELDIDISHFTSSTPIKRTEENIFIENSTAAQKVVRNWYKKGNYTPYICAICGQEPYWNGKELTLILDHINGFNKDDRLDNLRWVCPNCNYQLDTTNGKNQNHKERKLNYCIDCGTLISRKSERCRQCATKIRTSEEVYQVSREELKKLIRSTPFTQIGQKFGVSDNAVRKWCEKYNLPKKVSDISQYTDEEWSMI